MTYLPLTIIAVVLTGAACAGSIAAHVSDTGNKHGLRCELAISTSGPMVTITAGARSDVRVAGEYHLDIRQRSAGGHSTIRQSGDFALGAGEKTTLSEASFTGSRVNFDAELTLKALGKTDKCTSAGL